MRKALFPGVVTFAFIIFVIGSYVIAAQSVVSGEWTASQVKSGENGKINLSFERRTGRGHSNHGQTFEISELQGLSADQIKNGKVAFRLAREAGTIECEGNFVEGKGSGTFRFTPNLAFVDAMRSRGFDFDTSNGRSSDNLEDRLFTAATVNVTTALADDLNSAGFGRLDVGDLFKAAIFKVDSRFMSEMKASGFPGLGMEELVKARIFKIDPDYVRQVREMGFADNDFEGMVKFRIFKVTPELLSMLRSEGFRDLAPEEIVKFRIFKIDQEFIRRAKAENPNVSVEELVRMKIFAGK